MKKRGEKANSCFKSVFNSIKLSDSKRSQATVFILFAIVIAIAIGIAYFLNKNVSQANVDKKYFESMEVKEKVNLIRNSIDSCSKSSGDDCIFLIGIQGGYNKKPQEYIDLGWAFIPYYYKNGKILIPENKKIENELSDCYNEALVNCIDNINTRDFKIKYKRPSSASKISKGKAEFIVDFPFIIESSENAAKFNLKENSIVINSKLYEALEIASYLENYRKTEPRILCLNCVVDMAKERNLYVDYIDSGNTLRLVLITEDSNKTVPFSFEFVEEVKGGLENAKIPEIPKKTA